MDLRDSGLRGATLSIFSHHAGSTIMSLIHPGDGGIQTFLFSSSKMVIGRERVQACWGESLFDRLRKERNDLPYIGYRRPEKLPARRAHIEAFGIDKINSLWRSFASYRRSFSSSSWLWSRIVWLSMHFKLLVRADRKRVGGHVGSDAQAHSCLE